MRLLTREYYNGGKWTQSRFNSFIKSALRTASVRWEPRYTALNNAFVDRRVNQKTGKMAKHFECANCHGLFPQKEVEVNHKEPVVPLTGLTSWDEVIDRMFCEIDGLEVLCKVCHKAHTQLENQERKKYK